MVAGRFTVTDARSRLVALVIGVEKYFGEAAPEIPKKARQEGL